MNKKLVFMGMMGLIIASVLLLTSSTVSYADSSWDAKYWNNTDLSGDPVLHRTESELNYDWGDGSPDESVDESSFSARWKKTISVSDGTYRFTATMDDGMRVWVDDVLIIDSWWDSQVHSMSADVYLTSGDHEVKVKYYEAGGEAVAKLDWALVSSTPSAIYNWLGEYYNNTYLGGDPALVRDDYEINFNWGYDSPEWSAVAADQFSVRWTRDLTLDAGRYLFSVTTDDGVRLWVNNQLIIDAWYDHAAQTFTGEIYLAGGTVPVKMEYYDNGDLAEAHLTWTQISGATYDTVTPLPNTGGAYMAYVASSHLNVRQGPGVDYGIITTISYDTAVTLTQRNADASWVKVILSDGTQGWVSAAYLTSSLAPYTSLPIETVSPPVTEVPNNLPSAVVVNCYQLNVRSGPGVNYDAVTVIGYMEHVELVGYRNANATWVKIVLADGTQGWVNGYYLDSSVSFTNLTVGGW